MKIAELKLSPHLRNKLARAGITDLRQCLQQNVTPSAFLRRQTRARAGTMADGRRKVQDVVGPENMAELFDAVMLHLAGLATPLQGECKVVAGGNVVALRGGQSRRTDRSA